MRWLFRKKQSKEEEFWSWFVDNESALYAEVEPGPMWINHLSARLKRVHKNLVWQASVVRNGKREFVISADGIVDAFSAVESLADAAPPLPRWTIVRFRPREPNYEQGKLQFGDVTLSSSDVECVLGQVVSDEGTQTIGIQVFMRGCPAPHDEQFAGAAFILLDSALGEYDMECKVGYIGVFPFDHSPKLGDRIPFAELREEFDRVFEESLSQG